MEKKNSKIVESNCTLDDSELDTVSEGNLTPDMEKYFNLGPTPSVQSMFDKLQTNGIKKAEIVSEEEYKELESVLKIHEVLKKL